MIPPPVCECCETCIIAENDFAVDDLATNWDVRSGTPTISGGRINFSAGTNLVIHNTAAGASVDAVYLSADFFCSNTTDTGRLIIAYVDDSNYWYLEGQAGGTTGTLKLFERSGGVDTQRGITVGVTGFTTAGDASFQLCYADGLVTASARSGSNPNAGITYAATVSVASTKAGVGGAETGTVSFDNFSFQTHDFEQDGCPDCDGPGCRFCTDGLLPNRLQIDISGATNAVCSDCANLNGTYILEFPVGSHTICGWAAEDFAITLCASSPVNIDARLVLSGSNFRVQISITHGGIGSGTLVFQADVASPATHDCMNWNAFPVPSGFGTSSACSGTTVTITALDP